MPIEKTSNQRQLEKTYKGQQIPGRIEHAQHSPTSSRQHPGSNIHGARKRDAFKAGKASRPAASAAAVSSTSHSEIASIPSENEAPICGLRAASKNADPRPAQSKLVHDKNHRQQRHQG